MLSGIGEAAGIGYDVRFSLGLVLIVVILFTSMILTAVKRKLNPYAPQKESWLHVFIQKLQKKKEGVLHE